MFVGLPGFYGAWLMPIYGHTQHAGLAENVLDHRLNCRTVYMNSVNRFLYWDMNYHVEHHLFPLVPYRNLGRLHQLVKADMPKPYNGLLEAWREVLPTILRQMKDPTYYIRRPLPSPTVTADSPFAPRILHAKGEPVDGWVEICASSFLGLEEVIRFDHESKTYAIYRTADGTLYATDGICTHGNTHLATGFSSGTLIECSKHNGRFDITDGSPRRPPVCVGLKTYQIREHEGKIFLDLNSAGGCGLSESITTYRFRVVQQRQRGHVHQGTGAGARARLAAFPITSRATTCSSTFPPTTRSRSAKSRSTPPYDKIWRAGNVYEYRAANPLPVRRNFSIVTRPGADRQLRFNVRISTPPRGVDCSAGVGTTWLHRLKPGERVTAIGPFGSFRIKPGEGEMVYVGGGAGMAPLRSHLAHLFEAEQTGRRVSFWYGARSLQESFYRDYFADLAGKFPNFSFHLALSEPLPEDNWQSHTGFIHDVLHRQYLAAHPDPAGIEYYLCGPPAMIQAALKCSTS